MTVRCKSGQASSLLADLARSAFAFYIVFALYTATSVFLLLLGLASAVTSVSSAALDAFQDAAQSGSSFGPLWTLIVQTAPLSEAPGQVLLDYILSGINLGLGVPLLFGVIPTALFLAIVRDRLFDVEVFIGQTLVYGSLTAVLAVIFFGSAFVIQQTLRQVIGGPNEVAVAAAAVINGLLFQPMRRRIQQVPARRIRSRSVDANRALEERPTQA